MNTNPSTVIRPDQWVERKINAGKQQLEMARTKLESAIAEQPAATLAAAAGLGFAVRSLPVGRIAGAAVRLALPLLPPVLLGLGVAKAWGLLKQGGLPGRRVEACLAACDRLLRSELSAIATYLQAIDHFRDDPLRSDLERILADHEDSASRLRQHIASMGGQPAMREGIWGGFARSLDGDAMSLGDSPALEILLAGEKQVTREYQAALEDPGVMAEVKELIRRHLLPRVEGHLEFLDRIGTARAFVVPAAI
ncbi:DUF2383 domain-containing protein [Luteolibacter marinus]|uniref:DUF2383 domain-containing protein n=1 Tax=Luteolibacter marinus TaxID=2776705 RepID=UPI00186654A7|nr:DUF2383 domain-containing protein [Luteolibacter marinus]